jgi:predicted Zn-dependent peptidase
VAIAEPITKPRGVHLVDMNVSQSFIAVGLPGPPRKTPDYDAIRVMNFILGGDFSSRLNQSIRDRQGLAYGAHSAFTVNKHAGIFMATANTKTASTKAVLDSIFAEIQRLHQEAVNPNELSDAQCYLSGAFPMRFETNADVAGELRFSLLHQLPWPDPQAYQARIQAVRAAEITEAARKWLRPELMQVIVVGPADKVAADLQGFGPLRRYDKRSLIE